MPCQCTGPLLARYNYMLCPVLRGRRERTTALTKLMPAPMTIGATSAIMQYDHTHLTVVPCATSVPDTAEDIRRQIGGCVPLISAGAGSMIRSVSTGDGGQEDLRKQLRVARGGGY
eukprot:1606028-Rhodomonas_salina.1